VLDDLLREAATKGAYTGANKLSELHVFKFITRSPRVLHDVRSSARLAAHHLTRGA
jgi:hypothetical protein